MATKGWEKVKPKKQAKYRSKKTIVQGREFDSIKESERFVELFALQRDKKISSLRCQPVFEIIVNGKKIAKYKADFDYKDETVAPNRYVVEDVKSSYTRKLPLYRLKKKLVEALYGIEIKEI